MKDIEVTQLEAGSLLVRWKSLEEKEPACAFYEILFEGSGKKLKDWVKADNKEEYAYILPVNIAMTFSGNIIVHIKAMKPRKKATKTESTAVFRVYH